MHTVMVMAVDAVGVKEKKKKKKEEKNKKQKNLLADVGGRHAQWW